MTEHKLIDLSQRITPGMISYPGLPGPIVCDYLSREDSAAHYDPGTSFQIDRIEMIGNTGTYLDSPFHRYAEGKDLSELELEKLANLDCVVVRSPAEGLNHSVEPAAFEGIDVAGKAVLIATGWSRHWGTEAYNVGHAFLSGDSAEYLRDADAALVGIDSLNIDDIRGGSRPVHSALLGAEIPVVEHLTNLDQVPDRGARFYAVPPKFAKVGTFPVRAFVRVPA